MSVARKEWPAVQSHEKVTQLHSNYIDSLFMCICPFLYRRCAVLISFYNLFKLFLKPEVLQAICFCNLQHQSKGERCSSFIFVVATADLRCRDSA